MTQQLDMMPGAIADAIEDPAALERIEAKMPKARKVEPRLPLDACMHPVDALKAMAASIGMEVPLDQEAAMRSICDDELPLHVNPHARHILQEHVLARARRLDVGHELVLPERAREDHR